MFPCDGGWLWIVKTGAGLRPDLCRFLTDNGRSCSSSPSEEEYDDAEE